MIDEKPPCGGCHQWLHDPTIINGKCLGCRRNEAEIRDHHGHALLSERFTEYQVEAMRKRFTADMSLTLSWTNGLDSQGPGL